MTDPIGWARMWATVRSIKAPMLRRGAWYPVTDDKRSALVVLEVGHRSFAVPRHLVEIRPRLPGRFTVVHSKPDDPDPSRSTTGDLGPRYAVCPASQSRVPLNGHPERLKCPTCGHRAEVAWWETG